MIKVFKGGYEVAQEYYFNYESYDSDVYDSETRVITGLLHIKNLTQFQQLNLVNSLEGKDLIILEPFQTGYMVNLLNVREIEFTKTMSNTESIYRISGAKRMKPRRVKSYKTVSMTGAATDWADFEVKVLVSATVTSLSRDGNIRMAQGDDIRYLWASDKPIADLPYEIGKCRIESGTDFYITQSGGSNIKMQMPSKSGVPFPNGKIVFNSTGIIRALTYGQRLEVN